jgi:hypothetical protein
VYRWLWPSHRKERSYLGKGLENIKELQTTFFRRLSCIEDAKPL